MHYNYSYLEEVQVRERSLFQIIEPYLKPGDRILDVNCGYSPLARPLLEAGYDILGFDINPIPIAYLKEEFPKGEWHQISHEDANFEGFSVLLLLGFSISSYGASFKTSLGRLLDSNKPRVILAEVYKGPEVSWLSKISPTRLSILKMKGWASVGLQRVLQSGAHKETFQLLVKMGYREASSSLRQPPYRVAYKQALQLLVKKGYRQATSGEYDAKLSVASTRIYSLWERLAY